MGASPAFVFNVAFSFSPENSTCQCGDVPRCVHIRMVAMTTLNAREVHTLPVRSVDISTLPACLRSVARVDFHDSDSLDLAQLPDTFTEVATCPLSDLPFRTQIGESPLALDRYALVAALRQRDETTCLTIQKLFYRCPYGQAVVPLALLRGPLSACTHKKRTQRYRRSAVAGSDGMVHTDIGADYIVRLIRLRIRHLDPDSGDKATPPT